MKRLGFLFVLLLLGFGASQQAAAQTAYAYVTYFICDPSTESRADEIIKRNYKPHYDAAVEHGDIAQWSWFAAVPVAMLAAMGFGILLGLPILGIRGDYLAIATLGFGEIIAILARSDLMKPLIGGPAGITGSGAGGSSTTTGPAWNSVGSQEMRPVSPSISIPSGEMERANDTGSPSGSSASTGYSAPPSLS